jgi:hypothetical protein
MTSSATRARSFERADAVVPRAGPRSRPADAQTLLHEQHPFGSGAEDLPDGFLRLGVELPGGAKPSNIGGQPFPEGDPEGPIFIHRGGGGVQGRRDRVTMSHGSLSTVEVDGAPLTETATRVLSLWEA